MLLEVYDLECLLNIFTYTGYNIKEKKYYQYCICDWRNDLQDLIKHLQQPDMVHVGFNNESYDYPLLHYLLINSNGFINSKGCTIAEQLYNRSQDIINSEFPSIPNKERLIPQIDLYRIWHFRNKGCSLKDLEFVMRMPNIEDMPIFYKHKCQPGDEITILDYNLNDVKATTELFYITIGKTENALYKGKNQLALRLQLQKQFNINCINFPDARLGESIIVSLYAKYTNKSISEVKNIPTSVRATINLAECIPPWANFVSPEFNYIKDKFKHTVITQIKDSFDESIIYKGNKLDYGIGGLHSSKTGIFTADDNYLIIDQDVNSLYPSLAISLNLYPEHLGKIFTQIYKDNIVDVRLAEKKKPKEERNNVIVDGFKKAANAVYGKSNEGNSILYDPLYTAKITVAGQLFISLWIETLYRYVPSFELIQANTDGITYRIPKDQYDKINIVTQWICKKTGLTIENNFYSKMIICNVNNYIAQYTHGHLKLKGWFEIEKELFKDHSMAIVPIALKEYFINNIPIETTIRNHKDIFDFCLRLKTTRDCVSTFSVLNTDGTFTTTNLPRTVRYYVSNKMGSGVLTKIYENGTKINIPSGFTVQLFNEYKESEDYQINYQFYIQEANKIKNTVVNQQLELFNF